MARRLAAVAWVAGLLASLVALAQAGEGALSPPPVLPGGWRVWAAERTPLEAAAAVLRLGALAAAGYLLTVSGLGLVAAALRRRRVLAVVARWSPPVVQWLLGASLVGALAAGPAAAEPTAPPPTMVLLPDEDDPPPASAAPAPPLPTAPPVTAVTLAPGDHLWSVAARTLATSWGRPPTEREVVPYWRLVVELNRRALPNPDDPDLVFPGDVVRLPPVPR